MGILKSFSKVFRFIRLFKPKGGVPKQKVSKKLKFTKPTHNPLIAPNAENNWESGQTFNPAAILLDDSVHFLYRAMGDDGLSRCGYARSEDGLSIDERLLYTVYEHKCAPQVMNTFSLASGGGFGGCEDPRIVQVKGEDVLYMTYTACDNGLRVGLTSIKVEDFLNQHWNWKHPKIISPEGEVHKNWVIFPEKINGKYAILHSLSPKISLEYCDDLNFTNKSKCIRSVYDGEGATKTSWESRIRGAGAPPLKTKHGWLLLYHAMEKNDPGKYKIGAMLLDLKNPNKILYRSNQQF